MTTTAPPTAARPDPMPAARLGMWLFLASEAMFFVGLFGGFVVLLSAVGQRPLYHATAGLLSRPIGVAQVLLLIATSAAVVAPSRGRRLTRRSAGLAVVGLAVVYLGLQGLEYHALRRHHTVVAAAKGTVFVYDGTATQTGTTLSIAGVRAPLPDGFDVHRATPASVVPPTAGTFAIPASTVTVDAPYGPARNNFLASYFLLTAVHAFHVLGGLLATGWLLVRRTTDPAVTDNVGLYWHFVNAVGVVGLCLLYFT